MRIVRVPPENVRLQIAAGEVEEQQSIVIVVDRIVEQPETLVENHRGLPDELIIEEDAVGTRLVVLLKAGRVEQSQLRGNVADETGRLGDPHRRGRRVDIDRRDVEANLRRHALQEKPADAAGVLRGQRRGSCQGEIEPHPTAPLSCLQQQFRPLHFQQHRIGRRVAMHLEFDGRRPRRFQMGFFRSGQSCFRRIAVERQPCARAASFVVAFGGRVLAEILIRAVGAQHVRRTHARQAAVVAVARRAGRIVRRQVVESRRNPGRVQVVPERRSLPAQHGLRRLVIEWPEVQLQLVVAELAASFAGQRFSRRIERLARFVRMAMDEVEDAVRARIGAVDEGGPCHGALRRNAGCQAAEAAGRAHLGQVRQQALTHQLGAQFRVHSVDADHDHLLAEASRDAALAVQPIAAADRGAAGDGSTGQERPSSHPTGS